MRLGRIPKTAGVCNVCVCVWRVCVFYVGFDRGNRLINEIYPAFHGKIKRCDNLLNAVCVHVYVLGYHRPALTG